MSWLDVGPNPVIEAIDAGHVMHSNGRKGELGELVCPVCLVKYPCEVILVARKEAEARSKAMVRYRAIKNGPVLRV